MHGAGLTALGLATFPLWAPMLPVVGLSVVVCLRGARRRAGRGVRKRREGQ